MFSSYTETFFYTLLAVVHFSSAVGSIMKARREMVTLMSGVIKKRRAEQATGTSTVEKTDLLQVGDACGRSCQP